MKSFKSTSLYSRLALITSVTLIVGYFVVYAIYQDITVGEVGPGATITTGLMTKIKDNFDNISSRVTTLEGAITGASVWSKVGSDINYTTGNVGIGTATPAASLDVKRTAIDSQFAGWIEGSDANNYGLGVNIANTTSAKAIADFKSGNTSRLFVRADGNVGIGTNSPGAKLHISGSSGGTYLAVDGVNGQEAGVALREAGVNKWTFYNNGSDDSLYLYNHTQGAVNMKIDPTTGNVGIGTTSPGAKLHVFGNPQTTFPVYIGTTDDNNDATKNPLSWGYVPGLLISNDWDGDAATVNTTKVAKIVLNTAAGGYNNGASIHVEGAGGYDQGQLIFSTGWNSSALATERMRINAGGGVIIKSLAATYANSSAFVCVNNSGQLYASESVCP
ncbi:MAG: hypothetical protein Q8K26_05300 [Candidatus Gracilibacteria bacterium]|nr:hypothetical protein [Candidatus Gracilibacteria bacterium]